MVQKTLKTMKRTALAVALTISLPLQAQTRADVPVERGPFEASWESLKAWECPEWFRDVKFGIWAHWGPQCQAESGDWYGRGMYQEGGWQYKYHPPTSA